ncbi:MAG: L,D-transpeptidase family protein [Methylococcaceae bacterium]
MKALFILIVLALLSGCDSLTLALKSAQRFYADLPTSKVVNKMIPVDRSHASNLKTLTPIATQPPDLTRNTGIPLATPIIVASMTPLASKPFSPSKVLKVGARGAAVLALEKRLTELRYDVGDVDGFYDQQTWQGVLAFQKYTRLKRTGTYTLETQKALHEATHPEGVHPEAGLPRVEINLTRQVLLFFDEQGLNRVIAVSTGSNRNYCETSKKSGERICGVAHTPRGKFSVQWRIPGWRESDLGKLYNPLYFNRGIAIHGSPLVPADNVSHGCVRISLATSLWFYDAVKNGTPVIVFD